MKKKYYIDKINAAKGIDEIEAVVEAAAFDDELENKEYCDIVDFGTYTVKGWK